MHKRNGLGYGTVHNASVMVVVFAFPWLTAFVIRDIAADRSDAGAEGAIETFEGGTGGGGKGIGK